MKLIHALVLALGFTVAPLLLRSYDAGFQPAFMWNSPQGVALGYYG